jgi:hypothetical protein
MMRSTKRSRQVSQAITFYFKTTEFVMAHSRQPKGRGGWAFEFNGRPPVFSPSMTYGEAKKWVMDYIRCEAPADFKGCVVVNVCP